VVNHNEQVLVWIHRQVSIVMNTFEFIQRLWQLKKTTQKNSTNLIKSFWKSRNLFSKRFLAAGG